MGGLILLGPTLTRGIEIVSATPGLSVFGAVFTRNPGTFLFVPVFVFNIRPILCGFKNPLFFVF